MAIDIAGRAGIAGFADARDVGIGWRGAAERLRSCGGRAGRLSALAQRRASGPPGFRPGATLPRD